MLLSPLRLSLSTGYVLAGFLSCEPPGEPAVSLVFNNNPPTVALRSAADMTRERAGASSPDYNGEFKNVQGLTDGKFQLSFSLDFTNAEWPLLGKTCVQPTNLQILLTYTPAIYVNRDTAAAGCRYNTTLEHELRHVKVDVSTLEEFIPIIKKTAIATLALSQSKEPVARESAEDLQNRISARLSEAFDKINANLRQTLTLRQQSVDTRAEYERLSNACPNSP